MMNISKKPSNNIYLVIPESKKYEIIRKSIKKDDVNKIRKLISTGYNINPKWVIYLILIIENDAVNTLKLFDSMGYLDIYSKIGDYKKTPLYLCLEHLSIDCLEYILNKDKSLADFRIKGEDYKPLKKATSKLNTSYDDFDYEAVMIEILLKAGVDPYAGYKEDSDQLPIYDAVAYAAWPVFDILVKYQKKNDYYRYLEEIVGERMVSEDVLKEFIKRYKSKISKEDLNEALLTACSTEESLDKIEILLDNDADPNYLSHNYTPLMCAIDELDLDKTEKLLYYGAEPDLVIEKGEYKGMTHMEYFYYKYEKGYLNTHPRKAEMVLRALSEYRSQEDIENDEEYYEDIYRELNLIY